MVKEEQVLYFLQNHFSFPGIKDYIFITDEMANSFSMETHNYRFICDQFHDNVSHLFSQLYNPFIGTNCVEEEMRAIALLQEEDSRQYVVCRI